MVQKLKSKVLILATAIMFSLPLAMPATTMAADCSANDNGSQNCIQGGLCQGAQNLNVSASTDQCSEQDTGLTGIVKTVINILSVIVGIAAVVMIIIGGFRYITSGGASEKVTGAKNTILYALVGLIIVALAQVIVRFVLTRTTNAG